MNGYVDKLYDIDSIELPAELLETHVDESRVEAELSALGLRYAEESQVETVEKGDLAVCKADAESYPDGRTILIYTGTILPGTEMAAEAVIGKNKGDQVETKLAEKTVTLTIDKVIRRIPVKVDDALIAKIGIEGVKTVDDYKVYIRKKLQADENMEQNKMLVKHVMDEMIKNSSYVYDAAELDAYVEEQMKLYAAELAQEEETMDISEDEMREGIREQTKQGWMIEAFAKKQGIEVDQAAAEEEADQMIEMMQLMGEDVPDRTEMIEASIQNAYMDAFFEYVGKMIEAKLGGKDNGSN